MALIQYLQVREGVDQVELTLGIRDQLEWKWSASGQYSMQSAYNAMFMGQTLLLGAKELWKVKDPKKCLFFGWLVLHKRCWMVERCHCHGLKDSDRCALCSKEAETIDHLLLVRFAW
jgi:hypothetical protein